MSSIKLSDYLNSFQKDIFEFFKERQESEIEKIDKLLLELKESLDSKQDNIGSWNDEINIGEDKFKKAKASINQRIKGLQKRKFKKAFIDLEEEEEEKEEGITSDKRKIHHVNYKINNLKRTLAQKVKENDEATAEEERNYKAREAEFIRRLNIDIQREDENNKKEYSEIEKALLQTNDSKGIFELKRKIKKIRILGFKEQARIKNNYAQLLYQNNLNYERFYKKALYKKEVTKDDYNVRIKELETEKGEIELLEALDEYKVEIEARKKVILFEKDAALEEINEQRSVSDQIIDLKMKMTDQDIKSRQFINRKIKEHETETFAFDGMQLKRYQEYGSFFNNQIRKDVEFSFGLLKEFVKYSFNKIHVFIEEKYRLRTRLINDLYKYLLIGNNEASYKSTYKYKKTIASINSLLIEFKKLQTIRLKNFLNIINNQILLINKGLVETEKAIKEWCKQEDLAFKKLENDYANLVQADLKKSYDENDQSSNEVMNNINNVIKSIAEEEKEKKEYFQGQIFNVEEDYRNKLAVINQDMDNFQKQTNDNIANLKRSYITFKKKSQVELTTFRNENNHNLNKVEKLLQQRYKEELGIITKEKDERIKNL